MMGAGKGAPAFLAAAMAFAIAAGLGPARLLAAEEGKPILPEGAYLLPPDFRPGDLVELRLPMPALAKAGKRELRLPAQSGDYEIKRMLAESGGKGSTMSIFFIVWKSGETRLAPFESEGARFPGATVWAKSSLTGEGEKMRPLRSLLYLPGTRTLVAASASCLAALALVAWAFAAFLMPFLSRILSRRRARMPYRRFQHELRIMRKRLGDEDGAYFYGLLSRAFRAYASSRLFPEFASLTSGELGKAARELEPSAGFADLGGERAFVAQALSRADFVRFAGASSPPDERRGDMEGLSRIVEGLEASRAGA
jgi:hypothetical protein